MQDPYAERFKELQQKIAGSEGVRISNLLQLQECSIHAFRENLFELNARLALFDKPELILQLFDEQRREELRTFQRDIFRLLHNFLASVKTLVDHTRILTKELYSDTDFEKQVQSKVDQQFANSPLAQFVHCLRNYTLHKDLAFTHASMSFKEGEKIKISIQIDLEQLRKWDKWNQKAQEYLGSAPKSLPLKNIVDEYAGLVLDFHTWLRDNQKLLHKPAFDETAKLRDELKKLFYRDGLEKDEMNK